MKTIILLLAMSVLPISSIIEEEACYDASRLQSEQQPLFTFGVVADIQYCNCETYNTRFYRNSLTKAEEAINEIRKYSPSFIINLGDIIDRDYKSLQPVLQILESGNIKTYHTLGNHDFSISDSEKKAMIKLTGSSRGYYSFRHEGFRFIILNGNEVATYSQSASGRKEAERMLAELKTQKAPNSFEWNGGISEKQMEWLRQELDVSATSGEKVFLICHFPIWPETTHNLLNYQKVLAIISGYSHIVAWLNGHNHDGSYGNYNMIHCVTFRGMVETEMSNSFALIEVYSNKIWIKGFGREKNQILAY